MSAKIKVQPVWLVEFEAITKVITDRVFARLQAEKYTPALDEKGRLRFIGGTYVSLDFDYDEDRSRKFTIDATGSRILKSREGKFAYKDMTVDVNYEQLVSSLIKQVEAENDAKKSAEADKTLRGQINDANAEFGCEGEEADIYLRMLDDEIQLVLPTFKTIERAKQFLQALENAGLLVPASEEDDSEVQVAHSS